MSLKVHLYRLRSNCDLASSFIIKWASCRIAFCWLRMLWECLERFPRHSLQRKTLVSDPGMHYDTCVTHVPWCMSGSLTYSRSEDAHCIPSAYTTHNFTYLARGPWSLPMYENSDMTLTSSFLLYPGKLRRWQVIAFNIIHRWHKQVSWLL